MSSAAARLDMSITLLLDLDDTLLETNTQAFLPAYYEALSGYLSPQVPPADFMAALMSGIQKMLENEDPAWTLQEVFEADFYPRLRVPRDQLRASIDIFYASIFPKLRTVTRPRRGASDIVSWARANGHRIVVATDPVFPRAATFQRIQWAGLVPDDFDLISSFETFHFTKSHPAYFAELMGRIGWPDGPALMAGNDVARDLGPASVMGLTTYHVRPDHLADTQAAAPNDRGVRSEGTGDLGAFLRWLDGRSLDAYAPPLKSREAVVAMLRAAPAALHGLTLGLDGSTWTTEPSRDDWAMIELVCHLRDTEIEVHHAQITALLAEQDPFVPRPDAAVWAKQRKYLNEDGPSAVRQFAAARLANLDRLRQLAEETWSKPARHAIFGPTTFGEVIGFMADHDRMHLQQAWSILSTLGRQAHRN